MATIDLGTQTSIGSISLGSLQNYKDSKTISSPVSPEEKMTLIYDFKAVFAQKKARFIRVTAKVLEALPKGHSGEGKPAWLFADEIIVTK